jgi:hypothetical protein
MGHFMITPEYIQPVCSVCLFCRQSSITRVKAVPFASKLRSASVGTGSARMLLCRKSAPEGHRRSLLQWFSISAVMTSLSNNFGGFYSWFLLGDFLM